MKSPYLMLSDYRLQSCASGPKRAAGLQLIFQSCLRAGSDSYLGVIYEKLKLAYEILDKMVLPYHLCAPGFSAKSAFSA